MAYSPDHSTSNRLHHGTQFPVICEIQQNLISNKASKVKKAVFHKVQVVSHSGGPFLQIIEIVHVMIYILHDYKPIVRNCQEEILSPVNN